ncbi:unnamed protein product [Sphacelaria rigidula]
MINTIGLVPTHWKTRRNHAICKNAVARWTCLLQVVHFVYCFYINPSFFESIMNNKSAPSPNKNKSEDKATFASSARTTTCTFSRSWHGGVEHFVQTFFRSLQVIS